ncbi:hypothetical protein SERLA73DRAFT_125287 [Serpula lacrymans var. lacrymans S7.3]|uniref:Uncharacterized protein n=2 Tax=Serpula lacrymans var. lacrymans TaxID=341189 RepID=F8Q5L3_SERL3|nr:uncharacterized protein SERLADRAFT_372661 [Serpula lacrymans var. lacrymans S7.9]EGN96484.1 hypothetical protein SERLA73DRAFT_125287 [Serpula lacrymans var. lacrymans S7.3]EGO22031.1 hypothetical protein SERLADRAFT_372661 [Serpula lacrymans var. lacrymans S7.9]
MRGIVCAVAVGRLRSTSTSSPSKKSQKQAQKGDNALILDPCEDELSSLDGSGCFAFLFATGLSASSEDHSLDTPGCDLVWNNWQSLTTFDEPELMRATELAKAGAKEVWRRIKESVQRMGMPSSKELDEWKDSKFQTASAEKQVHNMDEDESESDDDEDDVKMEI